MMESGGLGEFDGGCEGDEIIGSLYCGGSVFGGINLNRCL